MNKQTSNPMNLKKNEMLQLYNLVGYIGYNLNRLPLNWANSLDFLLDGPNIHFLTGIWDQVELSRKLNIPFHLLLGDPRIFPAQMEHAVSNPSREFSVYQGASSQIGMPNDFQKGNILKVTRCPVDSFYINVNPKSYVSNRAFPFFLQYQ